MKRFGVSKVGWGSGEGLTFDERLEESEDTNLEGDGGGKRMSWAKALRWLVYWRNSREAGAAAAERTGEVANAREMGGSSQS